MRPTLGGLWALGLILVLVPFSRADEQAEALAIIDKAIKALGGEEKLTRANMMAVWKGKGTRHEGGNSFSFSGQWTDQLPNHCRFALQIEINNQTLNATYVVADDKGWVKFNQNVRGFSK